MSIADRMSGLSGRGAGISERMEKPMGEKPMGGEHEGGIPEHLKAMHAEHGGKMMLAHHHEGGITSHHVGEDGKVEGPHDHENTEALKEHMGKFFDEE